MIRNIIKDENFLKIVSTEATVMDNNVGKDLLDTLKFHENSCVGLAANMIGVSKKIIVFMDGPFSILMYNPEITKKSIKYQAVESCLSLLGQRETVRYKNIELSYFDRNFHKQTKKYNGYVAQIIQHEIDHCNGIVI